jgi:hypothetical protein
MEWAPNALSSHPTEDKTIVYNEPCLYSDSGKEFLTQWSTTTTHTPDPE